MIELEHHWQGLALLAAVLAGIHLWFPWFDSRFARQEARWMGFIGGIATGYVVLYVLPKIARITAKMAGLDEDVELTFGDLKMYYLLLASMMMYLLMVHLDTQQHRWRVMASVFDYAVHGAYSFLIGYVFIEMSSDYMDVNVLIVVILSLHLIGMNHILRAIRRTGFDSAARWAYFILVLTGAALGLLTELPKPFINAVTAFLAGIILVNVISEELPLKQQNRVPWFICGLAFYLLASYLIIELDPRPAY